MYAPLLLLSLELLLVVDGRISKPRLLLRRREQTVGDNTIAPWNHSLALASFAGKFLPWLYEDKTINHCSSSWGVSMALDLVFPGANKDTAAQMCRVLGFDCREESTMHRLHWSNITRQLEHEYDGSCRRGACDKPEWAEYKSVVLVANSVWIDDSGELQASYNNTVGEICRPTDFDAPEAGNVVNQWINESTRGLITSVLPEGPLAPAELVAVNSIYFHAKWMDPFPEFLTSKDIFYSTFDTTDGNPVTEEAHFMHMVNYFSYSHDALPGYQVLRMRYRDYNLSMLLVLPITGHISGTQETPTHEDVLSALPLLQSQRVALSLPKFQFEATYDLQKTLEQAGLTLPFEQDAFCGLVSNRCLLITKMIQKTSIHVNELGTTAAAATLVLMAGAAPPQDQPILFMADRPFFFYIYDSESDIMLFEGFIQQPTIPVDAVTPTFSAKHTDADFWSANFYLEGELGTPPPYQTDNLATDQMPPEPASMAELRSSSTQAINFVAALTVLGFMLTVL